jgi:hypothetical protein
MSNVINVDNINTQFATSIELLKNKLLNKCIYVKEQLAESADLHH